MTDEERTQVRRETLEEVAMNLMEILVVTNSPEIKEFLDSVNAQLRSLGGGAEWT